MTAGGRTPGYLAILDAVRAYPRISAYDYGVEVATITLFLERSIFNSQDDGGYEFIRNATPLERGQAMVVLLRYCDLMD